MPTINAGASDVYWSGALISAESELHVLSAEWHLAGRAYGFVGLGGGLSGVVMHRLGIPARRLGDQTGWPFRTENCIRVVFGHLMLKRVFCILT